MAAKLQSVSRLPGCDAIFHADPQFFELETVEEKIKFAFEDDAIRPNLSSVEGKCGTKANELRRKGNEFYAKRQNDSALRFYTESLFLCSVDESDDSGFSLALANRSAVLFELNFFLECLDDIERALHHKYPNELQFKLHLRKSRCLLKLHRPNEAIKSVEKSKKCLEESNQTGKQKEQTAKEMDKCLNEAKRMKNESREKKTTENRQLPELFNGENEEMTATSASLRLQFEPDTKGRFVVAKDDIPAGSCLFVEKPFASILLPHFYLSHCFHCCRRSVGLLPCLSCSQVGFCNEMCRRESWVKYHRFECGFLTSFTQIGIMHLSLRVLLSVQPEEFSTLKPVLERELKQKLITIRGLSENGRYDGSYRSVFHLQTHEEDLTREEIVHHIVYSCYVIRFLEQRISALENEETDLKAFREIFSGSEKYFYVFLLFRHSLQMICNAYAITEMIESVVEGDVRSENHTRIAAAIYPASSLLNHSCKPNVLSSFIGDELVIKSTVDLHEGDEVLNCYGPHYHRMNRNERQENLLTHYKFVCSCEACEREKPTHHDDEGDPSCEHCVGKKELIGRCSNCDRKQEEKLEWKKKFDEAICLIEMKQLENAVEILKTCLVDGEKNLFLSDKEIGAVYDNLGKCYALLEDFENSYECVQQSIRRIRQFHGEKSVEYALEFPKLTDIQVKLILKTQMAEINEPKFRNFCSDLLTNCEKGIELLTLVFGDWHPYVEDLKEKKQQFTNFSKTFHP